MTASGAVFDARPAVHHQVGEQPAPVVSLCLEQKGDSWVTPEAGRSLGVEIRREDDVIAVEAGPAQVDVGLAVPVIVTTWAQSPSATNSRTLSGMVLMQGILGQSRLAVRRGTDC